MLGDQISGEHKAIGTLLGRDFEFDAGAMLENFAAMLKIYCCGTRDPRAPLGGALAFLGPVGPTRMTASESIASASVRPFLAVRRSVDSGSDSDVGVPCHGPSSIVPCPSSIMPCLCS